MSTFNKYRTKGAFHWEWYETEDWYKYLIDRAVKFCKGKTLEIGSGDGVLLSKLPKGSHGVEPSLEAIAYAEEFGGVDPSDVFLGDADWSHNYEEYEYLACINTIEHLHNPEIIKELIRDYVTKGAIITTIDYQGGSLGEDHKFEWTYDEMMEFFKEFKPKGFRYKDTEWIGVEIRK